MRKIFFTFLFLVLWLFTACAQNNSVGDTPKTSSVKIKITIGAKELTAVIYDNATARDFVSLLPFTLTLEDYNRTEKISNLPKKLSTTGASSGYDPQVGDICLYAPWGNLCIFYKNFGYSNGLILLGKIDGDMSAFNVSGSITANFEVLK